MVANPIAYIVNIYPIIYELAIKIVIGCATIKFWFGLKEVAIGNFFALENGGAVYGAASHQFQLQFFQACIFVSCIIEVFAIFHP